MLIDSEWVGDWMASAYRRNGVRTDYKISLNPDGSFERTVCEPNYERTDRGMWTPEHNGEVLRLRSNDPDVPDADSSWRVLEFTGTTLMLRFLALASRNLPILFYRVHLREAVDA